MSAAANGRLGATEYAELVSRVRSEVAAAVPAGAAALVVSKGDAELLAMPGVAAAHFPQAASGEYAGHHPRDGATATAELEALRRDGAEYLVIPATARWWLDFYEELAEHLASRAELVADVPDACLIYGLGRRMACAPAPPAAAPPGPPEATIEQMRDFLQKLFPDDCRLVVLEAVDGIATALAPLRAARLPAEADPQPSDLFARLDGYVEAGAQYLVVPRSSDRWLEHQDGLEDQLEESLRKVADQRHLCRVFEINAVRKEP